MKKLSFLLALLGLSAAASAQQYYLVTFKDKGPEAAFYRQHPEQVLSVRALERRQKHGVELKDEDLPLSQAYLQQLQQNQVKVLQKSKWLNAVYVESDLDVAALYRLHPSIRKIKQYETATKVNTQVKFQEPQTKNNSNSRLAYGTAA
ncbi:MAG: hypothetical protein LPJ89_06735, partial [Hymenobacteraceae bacterium]|nr:hypothetical protein [Hymenobacteraceae bacterium]